MWALPPLAVSVTECWFPLHIAYFFQWDVMAVILDYMAKCSKPFDSSSPTNGWQWLKLVLESFKTQGFIYSVSPITSSTLLITAWASTGHSVIGAQKKCFALYSIPPLIQSLNNIKQFKRNILHSLTENTNTIDLIPIWIVTWGMYFLTLLWFSFLLFLICYGLMCSVHG